MPVRHTNRKGMTYHLCRGRTKTGKERYYFAREVHDDPVDEVPPGYAIRESVNGVVSLARDKPTRIAADEAGAIQAALDRHSEGRKYRIQVKRDRIEVYEEAGPDLGDILAEMGFPPERQASMAEQLRARLGPPRYEPVLRFTLADEAERRFRVERMCYSSRIDGWLPLILSGAVADLARKVIPTLGTDRFFELY